MTLSFENIWPRFLDLEQKWMEAWFFSKLPFDFDSNQQSLAL